MELRIKPDTLTIEVCCCIVEGDMTVGRYAYPVSLVFIFNGATR